MTKNNSFNNASVPQKKNLPRKLKEINFRADFDSAINSIPAPKRVSPIVKKLLAAHKMAQGKKKVSQSALLTAAKKYRKSGLSIIPTKADKSPVSSWKIAQSRISSSEELERKFINDSAAGIGMVCGAVSGNLICLDFDAGGEKFEAWAELVEKADPGLLKKLVMQRTPSGGMHVFFQVPDITIPGSRKLAVRQGTDGKQIVLIETREERGYALCEPSPGYEVFQGSFEELPDLTETEYVTLILCAQVFDERPKTVTCPTPSSSTGSGLRPGDDYDRRGDVSELLQRHGWRRVGVSGPNEHWCRPGKDSGVSATLQTIGDVPVFYCFSSSANVPHNRGLSPFQLFAALEHQNDYKRASKALRTRGYGDNSPSGQNRSPAGAHRFTVPLGNGQTVTITVECA